MGIRTSNPPVETATQKPIPSKAATRIILSKSKFAKAWMALMGRVSIRALVICREKLLKSIAVSRRIRQSTVNLRIILQGLNWKIMKIWTQNWRAILIIRRGIIFRFWKIREKSRQGQIYRVMRVALVGKIQRVQIQTVVHKQIHRPSSSAQSPPPANQNPTTPLPSPYPKLTIWNILIARINSVWLKT